MRDRQIRLKGRIYNQLSKIKVPGLSWSEFLEPLVPGIKRQVREQNRELPANLLEKSSTTGER